MMYFVTGMRLTRSYARVGVVLVGFEPLAGFAPFCRDLVLNEYAHRESQALSPETMCALSGPPMAVIFSPTYFTDCLAGGSLGFTSLSMCSWNHCEGCELKYNPRYLK